MQRIGQVDEDGILWTRSDEGHLSANHIDQLGQLVVR